MVLIYLHALLPELRQPTFLYILYSHSYLSGVGYNTSMGTFINILEISIRTFEARLKNQQVIGAKVFWQCVTNRRILSWCVTAYDLWSLFFASRTVCRFTRCCSCGNITCGGFFSARSSFSFWGILIFTNKIFSCWNSSISLHHPALRIKIDSFNKIENILDKNC